MSYPAHYCRIDSEIHNSDEAPNLNELSSKVESWISALLQAENLSLLIGSGLTTAICSMYEVESTGMGSFDFPNDWGEKVKEKANASSLKMGRGSANFEDLLRVALELHQGLWINDDPLAETIKQEIDSKLTSFMKSVLESERKFLEQKDKVELEKDYLMSFLLTFASRLPSRERLNIFTTNYDRFIELGCDTAGLHVLDKFIGTLNPTFRASNLKTDLHYQPPGLRGEPRLLEGVVRLTKLHGSLEWRAQKDRVVKCNLPFGANEDHPEIPSSPLETLMIYPNSNKDIETLLYPYADLFRDLASAVCKPNSVLFTYGYGFGDDHINRIIADMLTVPSTHLAIFAYSDRDGKIENFLSKSGRASQVSLFIGEHFSDLKQLVDHLLPTPSIDDISWRRAKLVNARHMPDGTGE